MDLIKATIPTRKAFGLRMEEYGSIDEDFVVFEADIGSSTSSIIFGKKFPNRYFDMGIAELGMVSAAAGMAANGRVAVASTYSIFLSTRALEVIRSFVCYPNLNVKFMGSHGGLTAAIDGVTHQATEDIANISILPNMKMAVPCDTNSARAIFDLSMKTPGPYYTRLLRDSYYEIYDDKAVFTVGGSNVLREGSDITIATYGDTVFQALEAAENLEKQGINCEVVDFYSIKPFDYEGLKESISRTKRLLVVENHQAKNGMGYDISDYLMRSKIYIPYDHLGIKDTFAESGKYLDIIKKYGLDHTAIENSIITLVKGE